MKDAMSLRIAFGVVWLYINDLMIANHMIDSNRDVVDPMGELTSALNYIEKRINTLEARIIALEIHNESRDN